MSVKNLLELDELSDSFATERDPKPKPRSRNTRSHQSTSRERDVDDVMSISSMGSSVNADEKEPATKTFYKKRPNASSAFDNPTFLTDDDPIKSDSSHNSFNYKNNAPVPTRRKKSFDTSSDRNPQKSESRQQRILSFESSPHDESDNSLQTIGKLSTIKDTLRGKEDDLASDSTYTVENERYRDTKHLTGKPPKPRSRRSKIPQKTVRITSASEQDISDEDKRKVHGRESSPTKKRKNKDHLVVQIDETPDGHDSGKADESETVSISSTATSTKESVKSRLGKLFSSSDDKSKIQDQAKEKSSSVNRWNWKNAFLKSSKSIDEGDEEGATKQQDNAESSVPPKEFSDKKEKGENETRIFMPDLTSEDEDVSIKSHASVEIEKRPTKQVREDLKESENKKEIESKDNKELQGKTSKFKPFTKLLRSRSKEVVEDHDLDQSKVEQQNQTSKSKSSEKVDKDMKVAKSKRKEKHEGDEKLKMTSVFKRSQKRSDSEDLSDQNLSNTASESDEVEPPQKKSPKHKRKKQPLKPTETIQFTDSSGSDLLFGITIHSSDLLPLDPNVIHPVVKVTPMFQNGMYIKRSQKVSSSESKSSKSKSDKRSKRANKKNNDEENISTPNATDSVFSIMSQPCHARYAIPTFAPTWNELLVFEEPFKRFGSVENLNSNDNDNEPILFFEIMDFLPINNNGNVSKPGFHGSDEGWYKVAWAFLKPIGSNGVLNLNKKLRLQLFKPVKLRAKEKLPGPEVFSWWKCGRKEKLNCTLYVTPKGIIPPDIAKTSLRQLLSMRKEHLTQAILDSQVASKKKLKTQDENSIDLKEQPNWSRMEGQSCKPPNKLVASLPSSQVESLNLVIAGNVHCVKFSPCGTKLVAGLDTDELHVILMFQIPSGGLVKTLKGHHGIVYDLSWKVFELDDHTSNQYLASASADSTVRIWKMRNNNDKTLSLQTVLYHPSYVYCVKFHPTHPGILATGCFDNIIRIWDMKPKHSDSNPQLNPLDRKKKPKETKLNELSPNILLDKHSSFVNTMVFDTEGQHLFSGDGKSYLYKWVCRSPGQKKTWKLDKDLKLHHADIPINSIDLHPTGNRLLVHLRDSSIKILDVASFIPLQSFPGIKNDRFQIRSCFSPCGNLVLSGSEDGTICIWDADTGKIQQFINPKNHGHCIVSSVDYHPWDYYVAVGLASTTSEPSPVLLYFYEQSKFLNYPLIKRAAQKMRSSVERSRSRSTDNELAEEVDENNPKRAVQPHLSAKRGDSSEKFISIIRKLDNALYLAQQRNQQRQSGAQSSTCVNLENPKQESSLQQVDPELKKIETMSMEPIKKMSQIRKSRPTSASTKNKREQYRHSSQRSIKSDSEDAPKINAHIYAVKTSKVNTNTENRIEFSEEEIILKENPVRLEKELSGESSQEIITKINTAVDEKPVPKKRRSKTLSNTNVIPNVDPE